MQGEPALAREILRYFLRNPKAADSLEGVAGWRLMEELIHHRVEGTRTALEWLVSRGFLQQASTTVAGPIYSLNLEHRSDAEEFVAEPGKLDSLKGQ